MALGLPASRESEEVLMLETRTHFEQVPLETVRKIVKEQLRRERIAEYAKGTKQDLPNDLADTAPKARIL